MKKFLFRLGVFLLLTFLTQFIVYQVFKRSLDRSSKFRITRYFRSPRHKYFVLGNSRGVNSINEKYATEKLKLDLINLSFNGEPYKNILNMIDDVNSKNKNSTIYLEISCLNKDYFDDSYAYYISNSKSIKQQFSGSVYNWISLLRLNNELFLRNIYYLKKPDNDWINANTITSNIIDHIKTDSVAKIFDNENVFYARLAELQKRCDDHKNKIIFFLAPYYPGYLYKLIDYKNIIVYMDKNSKKYNFINLNNIHLSDDMFADKIHTNVKGSILLTTNLINLSKLN